MSRRRSRRIPKTYEHIDPSGRQPAASSWFPINRAVPISLAVSARSDWRSMPTIGVGALVEIVKLREYDGCAYATAPTPSNCGARALAASSCRTISAGGSASWTSGAGTPAASSSRESGRR